MPETAAAQPTSDVGRADVQTSQQQSATPGDRRRPYASKPTSAGGHETAETHVYRHVIEFAAEQQILDELVRRGDAVLDIGTGATGRSALHARAVGADVCSIEINVDSITEFGALPERDGIGLAAADLLQLPFAEQSFEVVQVSLHGFDYVLSCRDRLQGLAEMRRVVKPGGYVVFNAFNPTGIALAPTALTWAWVRARVRYIASGRFLRSTMIDHNGLELHQGSVRVITNQAAVSGLELVSVRNLSGSARDSLKVSLFSRAPYYVFRRV